MFQFQFDEKKKTAENTRSKLSMTAKSMQESQKIIYQAYTTWYPRKTNKKKKIPTN